MRDQDNGNGTTNEAFSGSKDAERMSENGGINDPGFEEVKA